MYGLSDGMISNDHSWVRLKATFAVWNIHNSGNIAPYNYSVFTHKSESDQAACVLNFIVKGEGRLKVTGIHVHVQCKKCSIS